MASGLRSPVFFIILAIYLLAGTLFATLTPNWQAPDEPAHYNYVHYVATYGGFPQLVTSCYNQPYLEQLKSHRFPPEMSIASICYEFHQPPLYYLLAAPVFLLSGGSLTALRLLSVVLGAGVVTFAFLVGQAIFPKSPAIAYGTMALVAFVPMHVAMLASVNNDALAELILAALLLLLVRRLVAPGQPAIKSDVGLGVLLGLGLITKVMVYIAVPLVAVTLWLVAREEATRRHETRRRRKEEAQERGGEEARRRGGEEAKERRDGCKGTKEGDDRVNWLGLVRQMAIIYGLALFIALPWYIRNATLYGNFDLLGLARHNEVVIGQLRTADFLAEVGRRAYVKDFIITTFQSFWGQFGWMAVPMSTRVYLALTLLTLLALGGVVGFGRNFSSSDATRNRVKPPFKTQQRQALMLMALAIGLMVLGYGWYNLEFVQFQGRYLFPALIPLGLFMVVGLNQALSWPRRWWLVAGLALALGWVVGTAWGSSQVDKLVLVGASLALAFAVGRIWLARHWFIPTAWLMAAIYAGLALLALLSPFWYVIPYLSP